MSFRRFTDKADLDPTSVRALPPGHPALAGNRTLFPKQVVTVTAKEPDRLLVSGANNRKLGKTVEKGRFKGYALYGLSLEERATCPDDCDLRAVCYGNAMQLGRRHRIGDPDVFYDRLGFEIVELLDEREGLLVRLHVLGDFPSVEYVAFWADALAENDRLACYGYTHRRSTSWGGDDIGDAIQALKDQHPDRFRIRWSSEVSRDDGAMVIDYVPSHPRIDEGLICPVQTDATACCATCGFCWDAKHDTIVFIRHGPKSDEAAAEFAMLPASEKRINAKPSQDKVLEAVSQPEEINANRAVRAIDLPSKLKPAPVVTARPGVRVVSPSTLLVEPSYQRDLSGKSIRLIRRIVEHWDWAKYKPPICAETEDGLLIIDGQHTAIAAASHPEVKEIPVMIVGVDEIERRADAFVAHNRDRVSMSALQVFHAEVTAGAPEAVEILKIAIGAGCQIPRSVPPKGTAKAGCLTAITAARRIFKTHRDMLPRVLEIAALSGKAPIASTIMYGLQYVCANSGAFADVASLPNEAIAAALASIDDVEGEAQSFAAESGQNRYRACAALIQAEALRRKAA